MPLSADEVAILRAAERAVAGVRVSDLTAAQSACIKSLVRMGYVITAANDDGLGGRSILITDHGRCRLAKNASRR